MHAPNYVVNANHVGYLICYISYEIFTLFRVLTAVTLTLSTPMVLSLKVSWIPSTHTFTVMLF